MAPDPRLGLSCPLGGDFYLCLNSTLHFLGCCSHDPCADGTGYCRKEALTPTFYDPENGDLIQPQQCEVSMDSFYNPMQWYRCGPDSACFLCCSRDPCYMDQGCPVENLTAVVLSDDPVAAAPFLDDVSPVSGAGGGNSSSGNASNANPISGNASDAVPTGTNATSQTPYSSQHPDYGQYKDILISIPVAALILLTVGCIWYAFWRKRIQEEDARYAEVSPDTFAELRTMRYEEDPLSSGTFMNPGPAPAPPRTNERYRR